MDGSDHGSKTWVGRSIRRLEDPALLTGAGCFTGDLPASRWVRFVRSPCAAGRIDSVTAPARVRLFTAADLADVRPLQPMLHKFGYVPIRQHVLATGTVRYVGEPVAVVVAKTRELAEDDADAVELSITPTDAVVDAEAAMRPGAPLVHDVAHGNLVIDTRTETAGHAAALASAHRVVEVAVRSRRQNGSPLETRAAHVDIERVTGRVTLTCTTQMPHLTRTIVADLLGMPEADLRVVAPDVGGGFGQKMSLAPEYVVMVWLARRLRCSIGWIEDRRENLIASFHSRDIALRVQGGFDADARLVALTGDVVANVGAYAPYPNTAAVEPLMSLTELPGPYVVPHYACRARGVVTNTCTSAPYRGVARPAITLGLERLMDEAARAFGIDPVEIRRRNLVTTHPYRSPTGLVYDEATYLDTMELAVRAADYPAFRARQAVARGEGRYLGIGLSVFCERTGYGSPAFAARGMGVTPGWETVQVAMDPSGFVEARIGSSPHGQGLRTTLAQIIADELGCRPEQVRIIHGDTDRTPYGWGTFASRSLVIAGGASLMAARLISAKLARIAGQMLQADPTDIVLRDGEARVGDTGRAMPIAELARMAHHQAHVFADLPPGLAESATYDPAGTFSNACHIAIVEVDVELCSVRIEKFIVAEDAGRLMNPMIVDGQIMGGVAQGIANALLEEIVYDETGNILTATLADFLLPTLREIPPIEIHHLQTITEESVTGAKGLGEGGTIGAPAAMLAAVNDALTPFGVTLADIPITPARLHAALRAR
jgi:carbon-monoxide dehydrogenase large subunit